MNVTPIQRLVSRHLCSCARPTAGSLTLSRLLSQSSPRTSQHFTPTASSYGSAELLKRRYQKNPSEIDKERLEHAQLKKRMRRSAYGIAACALGLLGTIYLFPSQNKTTHLDAPPIIPGIPDPASKDEIEQIPTGTSTIPTFPKTLFLSEGPSSEKQVVGSGQQEYQLVGVGIRTVFYLEVYVAGLYVALPDIAKLQERLIRAIDPVATTLVPGEKGKLKELLFDPVKGQQIWNELLKDGDIRMAIRIVPTRNTDFVHLRDGWVRGITAKTQYFNSQQDQSFSDESFGAALNEFKTVLGGGFRKKVPWGETVLLTRDTKGVLSSWYEDKSGNKVHLGTVSDERISRLLWLIYLGGKQVSSEQFRKSVIDGVMEYVERPVGTVATKVV